MPGKDILITPDIIEILSNSTSPKDILHKFDQLYGQSEYVDFCFELIVEECFKRNIGFVEYIVRAEGHKRHTDRLLIIALCCAIGEKNDHIIRLILSRNAKTCDAVPLLSLFPQPTTLMHYQFNKSILFDTYYDPIGAAVCTDNVAILQRLLRIYDTQTFGREGKNSLYRYAVSEHCGSHCREYILSEARGDINLPDAKGETPLLVAARSQPWLIPEMLQMGADVNYAKPQSEVNALCLLSNIKKRRTSHDMDYISLARMLIQAGSQVNRAVEALCGTIQYELQSYVKKFIVFTPYPMQRVVHMGHLGNNLIDCFGYISELSNDHDIMVGLRLVSFEMIHERVWTRSSSNRPDLKQYLSYEEGLMRFLGNIIYILICNLKNVDNIRINSILENFLKALVKNHKRVRLENDTCPPEYVGIHEEIRKVVSLISKIPKFKVLQDPEILLEMLSFDKGYYFFIFDSIISQLSFRDINNLINDLLKRSQHGETCNETFLGQLLLERLKEIDTLKKMCRTAILECISDLNLSERVESLPLPDLLKRYVIEEKTYKYTCEIIEDHSKYVFRLEI